MIANAQAHFIVAIASRANLYLASAVVSAAWHQGITDQVHQGPAESEPDLLDQWQVLASDVSTSQE
jgi:hypothetical protein